MCIVYKMMCPSFNVVFNSFLSSFLFPFLFSLTYSFACLTNLISFCYVFIFIVSLLLQWLRKFLQNYHQHDGQWFCCVFYYHSNKIEIKNRKHIKITCWNFNFVVSFYKIDWSYNSEASNESYTLQSNSISICI